VHALRKYLEGWAEPDIALAGEVRRAYDRVLVVPAYAEGASFIDGYATAVRSSGGTTLTVVVANVPENAGADVHAEAARCRDELASRLTDVVPLTRGFFGTSDANGFDVLVVDRVSPGRRLPPKRGVGLARKIGMDVALALHARGNVRSPLLFFTDADASLPERHFVRPELSEAPDIAGALFPVWHVPAADPAVSAATALYEVSLRYYVAGLAHAGSPYAFHTYGSAIAVNAQAYAAVRGVPRRDAAEDFYLLSKLVKVGPVLRVPGAPIRVSSRRSARVPFGTGASVDRFATEAIRFYAPGCFDVLRAVLGALDGFGVHADLGRFYAELPATHVVTPFFDALGARDALATASVQSKTALARLVRVHSWFDAFRTMKLVHAVRDAMFPDVPFAEAIRHAAFVPRPTHDEPALTTLRVALHDAEHALPPLLGPTVLRYAGGAGA
jgi:hypothetical protein